MQASRFVTRLSLVRQVLPACGRSHVRQISVAAAAAPARHPRRCHAGLSLVEMLISLAITALLLTATMVAIDASFRAYAAAAETASVQTSTRLVINRLLTLVRTSTAHGPLLPDSTSSPPVTLNGQTIESHYLELIDADGNFVRIEYRAATEELWVTTTPYGSTTTESQPLLGGVIDCQFYAHRRTDEDGVLVLERGSIDLTVAPDNDNTLAIEPGDTPPIRVIASTMPRKLD